ncbi:MAG: DnaJ domain-containing protein [Bifidobacteriaceae bacterium]|jgi:molecular chaperone DnaJ|nr:DnaJ domain-containing protein [Bifidobacteriaceae bacterium]
MTSQDWLAKDFYKVLGVPADADASVIKRAFRKRGAALHPDANPDDPQAEERFKDLNEAYAVLNDPQQRQQYDALRAMARGGPRFAAGAGGPSGASFEDLLGGLFGGGTRVRYSGNNAQNVPLEDLLGSFGGGGGFSGFDSAGFGQTSRPQRGSDIKASIEVALRDAVAGTTVSFEVSGRQLSARLPAGLNDGQRIRIRGKGGPGVAGGPNGDVILTVHVTAHPVWSLDGANLRMTLPVGFAEIALGTRVDVPTLDGGTVKLKIPSGTPAGRVLRIKGRGIERGGQRGDLLVTVQVAVPERLSKPAKQALEAFRDATAQDDPRSGLAEQAAA